MFSKTETGSSSPKRVPTLLELLHPEDEDTKILSITGSYVPVNMQ
jgi:hypothetical protein